MPSADEAYPRGIPPHTWAELPGVLLDVMHQSFEEQDVLVMPSGEVLLGGAHWFVRVRKDAG
jgi:hypothetical protein